MRVKGPNGVVYDLPEAQAESLVRNGDIEKAQDGTAAKKSGGKPPSVKK